MRLTFLGTGTSAGIPAIGCDCGVCTSHDPRDTRLRTSACLRFTDPEGTPRTILIDAGPDLRRQALSAGLDRLDAILITHNHVDHTWGLDEVRRFNVVMDAPIDIYADAHTHESLRRVYTHIFDQASNIQKSFVATLIPHRLTALQPIELFGLRITPLPLLHGRLPVLGYKFDWAANNATAPPPSPPGRGTPGGVGPGEGASPSDSSSKPTSTSSPNPILPLAYCTDVSAIPPETWPHLRGLRTLILDALRHRKHPTHFTLGQAVSVAHEINADRTWFVHMAHDLPHEETDADLPERMGLAWDGLELA